jgi:CelD/BcsL family acetyltransferase involved in cellulose biosynthesis
VTVSALQLVDDAVGGQEDSLQVAFYDDLGDIAKLEAQWAALAASPGQPLFFQSPAWLRQVAAIRSDANTEHWRLCLATTWRGDRLTALWPLSLRRQGRCWIARCLDDPFGQFAGLLIDDREDPKAAVNAVISSLKTEGLAAGLMIERVAEGTALHRCLADHGANIVYSDQAVVLDFRPFDSFEAYLKTRRAKTRKNLRNARNRLTRDHAIEHDVVTRAGDIQSLMEEAFEGRLNWLQDQAKTAPAFRDEQFRPLLASLATSALAETLIGFRLRTGDGVPVSVQWGFLHAGRYYAFISARNPAFDGYSAGRVHLGMVLEACYERGVGVVEMMPPVSDYKMNWTDETRRIDDFGLALTTGGYLYIDLWRRRGRSMARRLYHGLPDSLRRHVTELTNKNRAS